jgi:16S rRNA (adenine1518-N6/adenine1519-N6)-dimethyltransferase
MPLFEELQNLMVEYRFRPNKKLGQHFVVDKALVERLIGLAGLKKSDTVLEIGAGTGFLTRELLKKSKVVAFEVDELLCQLLETELPSLSLVCGSFLKEPLPEFNKVVSLPPYFKSAEIVQRLLEKDFEKGVLVFQKEFADKLVAKPGFAEYCALTVLAKQRFETRVLERVKPKIFFPRPRGDSCIVVMERQRKTPVHDFEKFALFAKTVFRFKNKNLKNALENSAQFLVPKMARNKQSFQKKAERLPLLEEQVNLVSPEEFVPLFEKLF